MTDWFVTPEGNAAHRQRECTALDATRDLHVSPIILADPERLFKNRLDGEMSHSSSRLILIHLLSPLVSSSSDYLPNYKILK